MEDYRIVPAEQRYCAGHARTLSFVAQEGKYLSTNSPFSVSDTINFYLYCKNKGFPQLFVVDTNDEVVGWCDIVTRESYPDTVGFIGLGLMPEYRDRGIGTLLMERAIEEARYAGFREIRLDCRESNERALHLYRKLGFRRVAFFRKGLVIDGESIPIVCMRKKI